MSEHFEHHHEHDEHCDCGCHDHKHEHHHDHDEHCDCGCHDHEHEHRHDHDEHCGCGCHDHEHEHHEFIGIAHHDASIIGSLSGTLQASDYDSAEKLLSDAMQKLGELVTNAGGIIGHIKFVITEQGRGCQISVTDDEVCIRHMDVSSYHAEGVAIVFNMDDEVLRDAMKQTVGSVISDDD